MLTLCSVRRVRRLQANAAHLPAGGHRDQRQICKYFFGKRKKISLHAHEGSVRRRSALTASDSPSLPVSSVCRWDETCQQKEKKKVETGLAWHSAPAQFISRAEGGGVTGRGPEGKICSRHPAAKLFNAISQHIPHHACMLVPGQDNNPNGL